LDDIKKIRPTAQLDNERVEPYISNAQMFDIRPLLGDPLYYDMLKKFDDNDSADKEKYEKLLVGDDYTKGTDIYRFDGLKTILVYHTLARFIPENPFHITRFGFVMKNTDQSTPVPTAEITRVVNILKSNATGLYFRLEEYLDIKKSDFPLWKPANQTTTKRSGFKISKL